MNITSSLYLNNARLRWNADSMPESADYGDIYFSRADALGESTHVFLAGNRLTERFADIAPGSHFIIGELGFGSGLNFLNTCRLWAAQAPPGACLHYVACELHPLNRADMQMLHRQFPELQRIGEILQAQYPEHTAGVHQLRLGLNPHVVTLTLLYGDAALLLDDYAMKKGYHMDAWFLDGFSPKLNPALWQASLLANVGSLSKPGTTLSTYSVAAPVRNGLIQAGFKVEKAVGFGLKRHMLQGHMPGPVLTAGMTPPSERHAIVVGGGLAGCSTAFALAESGWRVSLLERAPELASQASGNPQGILHFRPVKQLAPDNHFNLFAFLYASRYYRSLQHTHQLDWHPCGHLQLASTPALLSRFNGIISQQQYPPALLQLLSAEAASDVAGVALQYPALFFPDSGWLSPPELCALYASHPAIRVITATDVESFQQQDSGWLAQYHSQDRRQTLAGDILVIANSADAWAFPPLRHLPLISNRGQVDIYKDSGLNTRTVICGQSYLVPASHGIQSIGGSYFLGDHSEAAQDERGVWHRDQLQDLSPAAEAALSASQLSSRRNGTRCIMPDRMPLAGAVHAALPGLYLNLAHGSHGLTRTPVCAQWLASLINGTPPPLLSALDALFDPARFPLDQVNARRPHDEKRQE